MAATADLKLDFEASVSFLATAFANRLSMIASRTLRREAGVSLMEWRVLVLLAVEPGAGPGRVGVVAGVDKSVVSRAVGALAQRALVRVEINEAHARKTRLFLTPQGQALHDRVLPLTLAREQDLLCDFSPAERAALVAFLKRLTANLALLEKT